MSEDRVGDRPLVIAPALAEVLATGSLRPASQRADPVEVDAVTFEAARQEMADIMRQRGFPLPTDAERDKRGQQNFRLSGMVVIARG